MCWAYRGPWTSNPLSLDGASCQDVDSPRMLTLSHSPLNSVEGKTKGEAPHGFKSNP